MIDLESGISVIMPTYNQGSFIIRAINSLFAQEHQNWELIIINDGSSDYTEDLLADYLADDRIRYIKNDTNKGLGACLNKGIQYASFEYISYLPSDDTYYKEHLSSLYQKIKEVDTAILCYAGLIYNYNDTSNGSQRMSSIEKAYGYSLQLVQVVHRKTSCTWIERKELVTDDLDRMFWNELSQKGEFVGTGIVSCEWTNHPYQLHKIIQESNTGGIYLYKRYYNVNEAIRFQSTVGNYIDEIDLYKNFRIIPEKQDKLKILLVGELAYNPERICALESLGHKLYGLWIDSPHCYNAVGPLPFGNIEDLSLDEWQDQVNAIKPDVIYALLNYQAVPLAHFIMRANKEIPFVWHFKEGPFWCRSLGIWKELFELYYNADGRIYINPEIKSWYEQFIGEKTRLSHILDGDLPSGAWFTDKKAILLSDIDGEIHTVASGRPYGIAPSFVEDLARHKIHLHIYGDYTQSFWANWINQSIHSARNYLHLHPFCKPEKWVEEYSRYDAGWLHLFTSSNDGELLKCTWDDLNYPARMCTLAAAGLPMIQKKNSDHIVASEILIKTLDIGIFFNSVEDLAEQLNDKPAIKQVRENVWANRKSFSFDYHAQELVDFFMKVIEIKKNTEAEKK